MPTRPAGPLGKRTVAAWMAVALVAWQAVESVRDVGAELGQPLDRHLRVLRASPEELVRAKLGADFEIWEALRDRVPAASRVLVSFANVRADYPELRPRIARLGALSYPTVLEGWPFDPARPPRASKKARREVVLDLESGRDFSILGPCEELASGPRFRLLIVGSERQ